MNTRLQRFLHAENITQAQFADKIGVARASVSHILAGRNKPGFDFIEHMSQAYPALSLDWLINGRGRMYKEIGAENPITPPLPPDNGNQDKQATLTEPATHETGSLFDTEDISSDAEPVFSNLAAYSGLSDSIRGAIRKSAAAQANARGKSTGSLRVSKVIVLFSDGSYQELK